MCAMPRAREGAPPVRWNKSASPTSRASELMSATVTGNPQELMVSTAACGVAPTIPTGEFTAKYTPGWSTQAAIRAITATKLSSSIEP